ncbi:MAG TPA: uroporphyrinogen decarboxylase [Candidatus Kapabacteria bacterium]|nr:uroporphyrinogen decarboxylase [Candidatus Kapabacteria bacterium]
MPDNTPLQNDLLLRAARRQPVEHTPVWFMRQAGRYLPEYRAVRAKADFLTLCKTPELAAEVTIQPVDIIGVDAAIIFSDILVIPEAMGMELIVEEGKGGPRFPKPLRNASDIQKLHDNTTEQLQFVFDAISLTKKKLNGRVPLIGFSGAPWTLATYAIEGGGSKDFKRIKELMYRDPATLHPLLSMFAKNVAEYLCAQVRAGADIVQIFDTWAGALAKKDFLEFGLRYIREIVQHVKANTSVPVIVFAKGANSSLREIAATGCDVVSVDWTVDIGEVKEMIGTQVALQGNLDPAALYAPPEKIREEVHAILRIMKGAHHIFNLGHGIAPDVPVEHAKAMVQAVKEFTK